MKTRVTRNFPVIAGCGLALVLAFSLGRGCSPSPKKKDWVSLSKISFGTRTNAGLVVPAMSVWISNVGPQKVFIHLGWFECRTKPQGTWLGAGNVPADPRMTPYFPVPSGGAVTMTMDITPTDKPADRMGFCMVEWFEREPPGINSVDELMQKLCATANRGWTPLFTQSAMEHRAYAANIEFWDYFYQMYWVRSNWTRSNTNWMRFGITNTIARVDPGTEEWDARQALLVFEMFCRDQ